MMNIKVEDGIMVPFTNAICKYCGKPFYKSANRTCYCSDRCRTLALKEQKAEYQRKRRKLIRNGVLISNETEYVGTGFLSKNRQEDFDDEKKAIEKELKRLRIKRDK